MWEQVSVALKFAGNNWTDPFSWIKLDPKSRLVFIYPQGNDIEGFNMFAYLEVSGRDPPEFQ